MTDLIFPGFLAGGVVFSFEHATVAGKMVLLLLAIASIFSWSVMVTKMRVVQFARKQTDRFLAAFRQDRQPLRLFESNVRFPGSPVFQVYRAGCEELTFHLLGSAEIDETFAPVSPHQARTSPRGMVLVPRSRGHARYARRMWPWSGSAPTTRPGRPRQAGRTPDV